MLARGRHASSPSSVCILLVRAPPRLEPVPPKQLLPARVFPAQDPKALAISAFLGAQLANPEDLWGRSPPPEPRAGPSRWPLGLALAWASQEAVA